MKKLITLLSFLMVSFALQAQLSTTNLPIVKITTTVPITGGFTTATMDVTDNTSGVNNLTDPATFTSSIAIKTRGNTAALSYPKLSYTIETRDALGNNNNTEVMGLPRENDWVLLSMYTDRSLLRGHLAMELHDGMGRYRARLKYCEILIDGNYEGIYLFGEKIKNDSARVDLATLTTTDNFGEELTGGYILNIDDESGAGFNSAYAPPNAASTQTIDYLYEYPKSADITPAQKAYIASYIDSFENGLASTDFQDSLLGWRPYGANNSLIDFIIINEVTKNYDGYRRDVFLYKDKNKKMRPGPVWGFGLSFNNTTDCDASSSTGWAYDFANFCGNDPKLPSFWWSKLMTDSTFKKDFQCRYNTFRSAGEVLDEVEIFKNIDSVSALLNAQGAQTRNFVEWPIFGVPLVNEPTPMATDYAAEVANLKTFITARLAFLDGQWPPVLCAPIGTEDFDEFSVLIYPNPADNFVQIELEKAGTYSLKSMNGQILRADGLQAGLTRIDLSDIASGVYILEIEQNAKRALRKLIVE